MMSDETVMGSGIGSGAQDEDRLPWLEAVDDEDGAEGISASRLFAVVVVALAVIGLVIGGIFWLRQRSTVAGGDGDLIAAAPGDYKVRPDDPGGMKVEGTGDVAYNVSEGGEAAGSINFDNQPEAPVQLAQEVRPVPAKKVATAPAQAVTANVANGSKLPVTKPKPVVAAAKPLATGAMAGDSGMIQLGAFSTTDAADKAWNSLTSRHPPLKAMSKQVVPATVNGASVYRLRASAGTEAAAMCAALKAVGASCNVVN